MARTRFPRIIHSSKSDGSDLERCRSRISFLREYIHSGSRGAELGVFTGAFTDWILALNPSVLYLVDPWYRQGSRWEWAADKPSTLESLVSILQLFSTEINAGIVIPVVEYSENFLRTLPKGALDWVYIDSTHAYEQTLIELLLACHVVGEDGIILGDDCNEAPKARHHGVYQAVKELEAAGILNLLAMKSGQFSARPRENWLVVAEEHYHHLMSSDTTLPPQARVRQIRLFFNDGPQVALYGTPSAVADGWVANLPATAVFAGDFNSLLYEVLIDAVEAHGRAPFHSWFFERHIRQAPQPTWPEQAQPAPASTGRDPVLVQQALRHLNTARILAARLAQQARRDNRLEDQQRFRAAAADACLKAADLQGDQDAATQLRKQALQQLTPAITLARRLAQQAQREQRPEDRQTWLAAAGDAALKAAELQDDADAAGKLQEQALRFFDGARTFAGRLAQQARREDRPHDRQRWLGRAADAGMKAADYQKDPAVSTQLRQQAFQQLIGTSQLANQLAERARRDNNPEELHDHLYERAQCLLKAASLNSDQEAASELRRDALALLKESTRIAASIAQQAIQDDHPEKNQRYLSSAAEASSLAASLEPDLKTAIKLRMRSAMWGNHGAKTASKLALDCKREASLLGHLRHSQNAAFCISQVASATS